MEVNYAEYEKQRIKNIIKTGEYIDLRIITPVTQDDDDRPSSYLDIFGDNATPYELALTVTVIDIIKEKILGLDNDIKYCYERMKGNVKHKTIEVKKKKEEDNE